MSNARSVAYRLLRAVEFDDAYANLALPKLLRDARLDQRDTGLVQELAFGTIRWQGFYDRVIEIGAGRNIEDIDAEAKLILRLGAHQLLRMRIPPHAALSETVELAKAVLKTNAAGFVNGVLRRVSEADFDTWMLRLTKSVKDETERLSIAYSHPVWIVRALQQSLELDGRSDELEALLAADNQPAAVNVVALPGFSTVNELVESGLVRGQSSPLGAELVEGNPLAISAIASGKARVQDQGSQLVALAMLAATGVKSGEQWLDLCAGPGGKAALLAALAVEHDCELTCNEIAEHRAELVENALRPLHLDVYVRVGDGRDLGADAPAVFDRILVDAPCTGLGALRRRPEARWRKQPSDLGELTALQKQLLESAWAGLKPGGVLAYSTCSPHVSETVAIVDWALKKFGDRALLLNANQVLSTINPALDLPDDRKTAQLWPQAHGTDAMFIALIQKS
jgi:16S rRNA (cytosine967-C5)-methyltransferase